MKVGDLVRATEGQIVGMLGILTRVEPLNPGSKTCEVGDVADILWNDGNLSWIGAWKVEAYDENR